jgi:5-methylcytosine-specific restriction endonuclease McrA
MRFSPTMRWRSQAILRVIQALRKLLPISHALILSPNEIRAYYQGQPAKLRQQLIDSYGHIDADGARHAMCAYCRTTQGRIEAEHILPSSRGGTDGWQNRVLACASCNARKGDRLPEEAGMPLQIVPTHTPAAPNRAGNYARSTAQVLVDSLIALGIPTHLRHQTDATNDHWPIELHTLLLKAGETGIPHPSMIARPITRPTKQIFAGRNYPLTTRMRPGMVRLKHTIRRRVQVNRALAIGSKDGQRVVRAIPADQPIPAGTQIIVLGMLCEGLRREQRVTGIVVAIHSTGRLTLLIPQAANSTGVAWKRVVVSPRQHLRVLSTDRVIFMPAPSNAPSD